MKHKLDRFIGLTVGDLKAELEDYSDDLPVFFAYNFGDHCQTPVAEDLGNPTEELVTYSDYHQMLKVVDQEVDGTDECQPANEDFLSALVFGRHKSYRRK